MSCLEVPLASTHLVVLKLVPIRAVTLLLMTAMRTPGSSAARHLHPAMWLPGNKDVSTVLVTITVLATTDLLLGRSVAVTLAATAVVAMNPVVATAVMVVKATLDTLLPELLPALLQALLQALLRGNSRLPPVANLHTDMEDTVMLPLAWLLLPRRPAWLLGPTELLLLALLALAALRPLLRLSMDLHHHLPVTSLLPLLLRLNLFASMQLVSATKLSWLFAFLYQ